MKQILILGGGFAGVYTAMKLETMLRKDEATITLVNRENYWVYQPLLPEVVSASIGLTDTVSPIRRLCPRTNLVMRDVEGWDSDEVCATLSLTPGNQRVLLHRARSKVRAALEEYLNEAGT